jgi:hypothetical protein
MTPASFESTHQSGTCAGAWMLAARKAMSLRPREQGVLEVKHGKVWITVEGPHGGIPGDTGDHVLAAGERITVQAHRHVVIEAWKDRDVCFDWVPLPQAASAQAGAREALIEPLRELRQAAGLAAHACGQLAGGLARLVWVLVGGRHHVPAPFTAR